MIAQQRRLADIGVSGRTAPKRMAAEQAFTKVLAPWLTSAPARRSTSMVITCTKCPVA